MARPVTGTFEELDDGRCRAGLSEAPPSTKYRLYIFPNNEMAERWLNDAKQARAARLPLPDPTPYQEQRLAPRPKLTPTGRTTNFETFVYQWHHDTYELNHQAQAERSAAVLTEIESHILPFARAIGLVDVADMTHDASLDFARFLGGWPLDKFQFDGHNARRLEKSTAKNILGTWRRIAQHAAAQQLLASDPTVNVKAMAPKGGSKTPDIGPPVTLPETAQLARHLSVVHQVTVWIERLLGTRQGETFGFLVEHYFDLGEYGLLAVRGQGGRKFKIRDAHGEVHATDRVSTLKRGSSLRVLVVPPSLKKLIDILIQAYHTDPETGQIYPGNRLIPGILRPNASGQNTFWRALRNATQATGIADDDLQRRISPHHLRRSVATTLAYTSEVAEVHKHRFMGQRAGDDVFLRHYVLDDPTHAPMLAVAEQLEEQVRAEVGDLIVPTSLNHQWGLDNPIRDRLEHADTVLALAGWQVPPDEADDPWCTTSKVARLLGISESTTRRKMAAGDIDADKRPWGERQRWVARRSAVQAYRDAQNDRLDLNHVAADRGMGYHEAYHILDVLGMKPDTLPGERQLHVTHEHVEALDDHIDDLEQLHQRSMTILDAARQLPRSERSLRDYAADGRLEKDPVGHPTSNAIYVTRKSVQRLCEELEGDSEQCASPTGETVTFARATHLTGLGRADLRRLVDAGLLETVQVDRATHIVRQSLIDWAAGYRPDLLERLGAGP